MNKEKKFYIAITTLLLGVSLITLGFEVAAFNHLSGIQGSLKEKEYYSEKLSEKEEILKELEGRYSEVKKYLPLIDNTLPAEKETSKILSDINTIAEQSGLKLIGLEPKSEESTTKKAGTNSDLSMLQTKKGRYGYELPLEIRVRGSYSNFVNFVKNIENYQRLLSIENLTIEKRENDSIPDYIESRIFLKAFIKK